MDKKAQSIETYNKNSKLFIEKFNKYGARIDDIKRAFSYINKTNPKIVELGCGNGREAKEIVKHTDDYIGIDLSEKFTEEAKKELPSINFLLANFEEYIFPQEVDIIFAFASLIHTNETSFKNILEKVYSALNKDGIFYISLKHGEYKEVTKKVYLGTITDYLYTLEKVSEMAGNKYKIIYNNTYDLRNQKWLDMILQK